MMCDLPETSADGWLLPAQAVAMTNHLMTKMRAGPLPSQQSESQQHSHQQRASK